MLNPDLVLFQNTQSARRRQSCLSQLTPPKVEHADRNQEISGGDDQRAVAPGICAAVEDTREEGDKRERQRQEHNHSEERGHCEHWDRDLPDAYLFLHLLREHLQTRGDEIASVALQLGYHLPNGSVVLSNDLHFVTSQSGVKLPAGTQQQLCRRAHAAVFPESGARFAVAPVELSNEPAPELRVYAPQPVRATLCRARQPCRLVHPLYRAGSARALRRHRRVLVRDDLPCRPARGLFAVHYWRILSRAAERCPPVRMRSWRAGPQHCFELPVHDCELHAVRVGRSLERALPGKPSCREQCQSAPQYDSNVDSRYSRSGLRSTALLFESDLPTAPDM